MLADELGRRFERLLYISAPISIASLLLLFIVIAANNQRERVVGQCYEFVASAIESREAELNKIWDEDKDHSPSSLRQAYRPALQLVLRETAVQLECFKLMLDEMDERYRARPKEIASKLRKDAEPLQRAPLSYGGVELPEKASIDLLGTSIKIEVMTFARALQLVLAPLMILWLGSLYNTRYRETLLIADAKALSAVFPHLVNVYPAMRFREPRKRSRLQQYVPALVVLFYTLIRVALLLIFIGPPVGAYVLSLFLFDAPGSWLISLILQLMVSVFALALVLAEFLPWHLGKMFPGPPVSSRQE